MNQFVMLAVSEKVTRLDADAQFAHLDALERFASMAAEEENATGDELLKRLLDRARDEEPEPEDRVPSAQSE